MVVASVSLHILETTATDSLACLEAWLGRRYGCRMVTLRLATADDARAIADIYAPSVTDASTSFELTPPTESEIERRMTLTASHAPWLVCATTSEVLGFAYASRHRDRAAYQWSVDASVYVSAGQQRRGVGRALYASLFALLRLQGFYTVHAGIALPNPGSVGLHEAVGFRLIGVYPAVGYKRGAWRDVGWWQLPLRERVGDPAPPLSVADARALPGWEEALVCGLHLLRP